jgi:serine/threonine protein phosphatase PrpC
MGNSAFTFDAGSATHTGKVRQRNEDSYLVRTDAGLWAVADGMGGHEAGDIASRLVMAALDTITVPESAIELLEECESRVLYANRQIIEMSRSRGGAVIGTTIAILLISDEHYACVWAGDSRIYLVRHGAISQLSRDHTELEELIASGAVTLEESKNWPSNIITHAIGVEENPELEVITGDFAADDIFVICSDGLTKHVHEHEILSYVSTGDAQTSCNALVDLTLERGAADNVTIIVVRPRPLGQAFERTIPQEAAKSTIPPASEGPKVSPMTDVWE